LPPEKNNLAHGRAIIAAVLLVVTALVLVACGGSSSSSSSSSGTSESGSTTEAATTPSGGSADAFVKEAQEVVKIATGKLVYSQTDAIEKPSQIEPYGEWRGPTSAPPHQPGKVVEVVTATAESPPIVSVAEGVKEAGEALGWKVDIVNSATATPEGWATAFNTALSRHPDAIVGAAVPGEVVQNKIEKAESEGILTISVAEANGREIYESNISARQPFELALDAFGIIAHSEGKANVVGINVPEIATISQAVERFEKLIGRCAECSLNMTEWTFANALEPAKASAIISGLLRTNPEADYLMMPASTGIPSAVSIIRSLGGGIEIVSKDADEPGLQETKEGSVLYNAGVPTNKWLGWAAADNLVRGFAGKPQLGIAEQGLPVVLYTQETTPESANSEDIPGLPDYAAKYEEVWGVGG
jgi:ribose transport system substrate-binding protein